MILDRFKEFIDGNKSVFTDDVYGLFNDSIRCYSASIYRPAYLIAYQAVMHHLRHLLQTSKRPDDYDEGKWTGVQVRLKNDKTFDDEVFTCTQHKTELTATSKQIAELDMPDAIRDDFRFWRNRRNDCAHYKMYEVNNSHVLAFYSFVQQYLLRISVEGGKNTLLRMFKEACDVTKTSPNGSLLPLIDKILGMVAPDQMDMFFDELSPVMGYGWYGQYFNVLSTILSGTNITLKKYLIHALKVGSYLIEFLNEYPEYVGDLLDEREVREYCYKKLAFSRNRIKVYAHILMSGLIKKEEIKEFNEVMVKHCYSHNEGFYNLTEDEWLVLKNNGILEALHDLYFNVSFTKSNALECGRSKYDFFEFIVRWLPIDAQWVKILIDIFDEYYYPQVWLTIYKRDYLSAPEYRNKFEKVCSDNGYTIPKNMVE